MWKSSGWSVYLNILILKEQRKDDDGCHKTGGLLLGGEETTDNKTRHINEKKMYRYIKNISEIPG